VIPVAGVALVLGIHRFMGEAMAVTNLVGNGVATIVVGKWCDQVDDLRLAEGLAGNPRTRVDEPETLADVV
jgi:aerobic C4-dicarboxylate transport protein